MKHIKFLFFIFIFSITSCSFFSYPEATSEVISTYTKESDSYHYLYATIKITNISDKKIYNSTISVKADSTKKSYYKTSSSNITIHPGNSIYLIIDLSFEKKANIVPSDENDHEETEKWIEDSVIILDSFWN